MKRAFLSIISFSVVIAMAFAFTLLIGTPGTAEAALSTAGKVTSVEGKVAVFRKGKARGVRVKVGTLIFPGDKIKTYADSKAQLTLRDNSKIIIAPKSTMKMGKFALNRKMEKRSAFLSILGGKIRIVAQKMYKLTASGKRKLWRNASFKIKTPTAVVGVKGTDFVITVTMKDGTSYTGVIVVEGLVATQALKNGTLSAAVLISRMESVTVTEKDGVSPKKTLTQAEVDSVVQNIETETGKKEGMLDALEDYEEKVEESIEEKNLDEDVEKMLLDDVEETFDAEEQAIEESFADTTTESITIVESTTSGGTTTCTTDPCP